MSGLRSIVSVRSRSRPFGASAAGTASSNTARRDRHGQSVTLGTAGTFSRWQVSRRPLNPPNQSPCRNRRLEEARLIQEQSDTRRPRSALRPSVTAGEVQRITFVGHGEKRRFGHSAHLMRACAQMPRTHSFAQRAHTLTSPSSGSRIVADYTSSRPRKSARNSAIFRLRRGHLIDEAAGLAHRLR